MLAVHTRGCCISQPTWSGRRRVSAGFHFRLAHRNHLIYPANQLNYWVLKWNTNEKGMISNWSPCQHLIWFDGISPCCHTSCRFHLSIVTNCLPVVVPHAGFLKGTAPFISLPAESNTALIGHNVVSAHQGALHLTADMVQQAKGLSWLPPFVQPCASLNIPSESDLWLTKNGGLVNYHHVNIWFDLMG